MKNVTTNQTICPSQKELDQKYFEKHQGKLMKLNEKGFRSWNESCTKIETISPNSFFIVVEILPNWMFGDDTTALTFLAGNGQLYTTEEMVTLKRRSILLSE